MTPSRSGDAGTASCTFPGRPPSTQPPSATHRRLLPSQKYPSASLPPLQVYAGRRAHLSRADLCWRPRPTTEPALLAPTTLLQCLAAWRCIHRLPPHTVIHPIYTTDLDIEQYAPFSHALGPPWLCAPSAAAACAALPAHSAQGSSTPTGCGGVKLLRQRVRGRGVCMKHRPPGLVSQLERRASPGQLQGNAWLDRASGLISQSTAACAAAGALL